MTENHATAAPGAWLRDHLAFRRVRGAVPALDGLRALAILLVLGRHGARAVTEGAPALFPVALPFGLGSWDLGAVLWNGWAGVDLFFVLSGYLISRHLLGPQGLEPGAAGIQGARILAYLRGRALRIVPAYYAVLLVVALGLIPFYPLPPGPLGGIVAYHLLFLQDYLPATLVVAFWSLGVEEKFYLLAPLLLAPLLLAGPRGPAGRNSSARLTLWLLAGLAVLPALGRHFTYAAHPEASAYDSFFFLLRSPFHFSVDSLLIGMLAAVLLHGGTGHGHGRQRGRGHGGRWLFLTGAALAGGLLLGGDRLAVVSSAEAVFLFPLLALGFALMLAGLVRDPLAGGAWLAACLGSRACLVLARLSYTLYLVHMTVIPGLLRLYETQPFWQALTPGARFLVFCPLYGAASLALALGLHYLVEKPFLRLKERGKLPSPSSPRGAAATLPSLGKAAPR